MEEEVFEIPVAEEILKLIQEVSASNQKLNNDEENPMKFLNNIDSCLTNVQKLVKLCDELSDSSSSSSSDKEYDFDKYFEEIQNNLGK